MVRTELEAVRMGIWDKLKKKKNLSRNHRNFFYGILPLGSGA
jgi:hypothetical protein